MMKHTKIVATLSDQRCDPEFIAQLHEAGVNVIRLNSAHLTPEGLEKIVTNTRAAGKDIATMIDTKGPEVRTTPTADGEKITFSSGDSVVFLGDPDKPSTHQEICVNYTDIARYLHIGARILIDDGELEFVVTGLDGGIQAQAVNDGLLGSRKTVNIPDVSLPLESVTERDRRFITMAHELGVDFVAHSFVRSAADVAAVQAVIDSLNSDMKIISKIENREGVDNFDSILAASYGIMVARGDLGIEVGAEAVPAIQISMVNKCIAAHKPVIVATQMLHSMIEHPRPTRAEVSDVASAVYQRADALMLSGETAAGRYPVESVMTMAKIAREVEKSLSAGDEVPPLSDNAVASFLARQAVVAERKVGTRGIIADSYHGATARYIASYRGHNPVFAVCYNEHVARLLALSYGVVPFVHKGAVTDALHDMLAAALVGPDDIMAYLHATRHGAFALEIAPMSRLVEA